MLRFCRYLLLLIGRFALSLRYRVRILGLDQIKKLDRPILILPNHPAYADPPIVVSFLDPGLSPRPLLFEGNFQGPVMRLMMWALEAIRVPDTDQISAQGRARTLEAIEEVKSALRSGRNVVLWPSGRLQRNGLERLGAARTLSDVLKDVPEAKIVLARTRGLWGSRFSYGWDGTAPPMGKRFLQGVFWVLSNLVFFTPRRNVTITLEHVERDRLPGLEREQLNPWLEKWYNTDPEERLFVPVHFLFGARTHEFPPLPTNETFYLSKVKDETRQAVNEMILERISDRAASADLKPEMHLDAFGLDSLLRSELSQAIEKRFGFTADRVPETVGELYALASGLMQRQPPPPPSPVWFSPPSSQLAEILGDSIPEAFVARALASRRDVVCADDRSGILTYERVLVGALLMARRFRQLPGKHVGLLLPASAACDLALLGLYLADKIPVVLNWTTGPANLAHAARLTELQHVITSQLFIDRTEIQVNGTEYLFLEELRKQLGKLEALATLLQVRFLPGSIRRQTPRPDPNDPAVILFTSGSEKAPKAVPLTHRNIIINQRGGIQMLQVDRRDSILGFLPAFHSFGLSITGLFPLLSGVRVVRHPDPTDSFALARKIGLYKPTILVGTPTFVSYILDRAEPGELTSLRMVIVGAEKCPQSVFDRLSQAAPKAEILEGYGITECAPVVSVNPIHQAKRGTVGKALPGVELLVVDLETDQPLPPGKMGMLLVAGPTVFPGYLGDSPSPFREINGKRWYVTGDLVSLDEEGYIHFTGRLKRFIKAGGEMISLPALEEPFTRLFPPSPDGPRVAVEGIEQEGGGRKVVLFTTEPISPREANEILVREGFHGVMRLDEVRRVEAIPMLGTGKADYKQLRALIENHSSTVTST